MTDKDINLLIIALASGMISFLVVKIAKAIYEHSTS